MKYDPKTDGVLYSLKTVSIYFWAIFLSVTVYLSSTALKTQSTYYNLFIPAIKLPEMTEKSIICLILGWKSK